jgi:hypothetical protein
MLIKSNSQETLGLGMAFAHYLREAVASSQSGSNRKVTWQIAQARPEGSVKQCLRKRLGERKPA